MKNLYCIIVALIISNNLINCATVTAEIAVGELIDKITILQIKAERIKDPAKLINITTELQSLQQTLKDHVPHSAKLDQLTTELKQVNEALWDIEDAIREEERHQRFGATFIELARKVYFTNDRRCEIKRQMNMAAGSRLIEEKSYSDYRTQTTK